MPAPDRSADLVGVWRLVDITNRDPDGKLLRSSYGPKKEGLITFNDDHRMMVVICDGRDVRPTDRPREYVSYAGRYTFDGTTLVTRIDCSAVPRISIGSDQVRPARIEGNRVILTAPPVEIEGIVNHRDLTWEKIA